MHIGLIVGFGPAATDYYYRHLISAAARAGNDLELTMAHADTPTVLRHQSEGNVQAQVDIYGRLTERMQRAEIAQVAVIRAGKSLTRTYGCECIMLAGTDLSLVFRDGDNPGFETLHCTALHAAAIAAASMTP